jgi:nucleotide-binding universal stress UspA family protein
MFQRVLVGVDFRPSGRDAIALASQLLDTRGAMILAHAYVGRFMPSHAVAPGMVREERERAETQLQRERDEVGVDAELIVAEGPSTGRVLHEHAEEAGADLLVLGSCHRGVFGRAMLGDDTRAALNGAPCAVAIAPAGYAEHPTSLTTIGVGYDGSPESKAALQAARAIASSHDARIRALQIVSPPSYSYTGLLGAVFIGAEELVERADTEMKALDGVEGRAEYGLPAEDLASFANEVDLLIVGSRGYGPWGRLVHGSTSGQLARHARGALLILPRSSRKSSIGPGEDAAGHQATVSA